MKNPFPGMNPYLEQHWGDVHARATVYIADQLHPRLPSGLVVRAEEQITIDEGERSYALRPDVHIAELKEGQRAGLANPADDFGIAVADPVVVLLDPDVQRWVEIRDSAGRLITVIELLSPTNKSDAGQAAYRRRQGAYIAGGVNLIEIDLLRRGERVISLPSENVPNNSRTPYIVCVRAAEPGQREIYPMALRARLPAIRTPLRPTDRDVALDLQPVIDQSFERGHYSVLDYARDPEPPISDADRKWLDDLLRKAGLRT